MHHNWCCRRRNRSRGRPTTPLSICHHIVSLSPPSPTPRSSPTALHTWVYRGWCNPVTRFAFTVRMSNEDCWREISTEMNVDLVSTVYCLYFTGKYDWKHYSQFWLVVFWDGHGGHDLWSHVNFWMYWRGRMLGRLSWQYAVCTKVHVTFWCKLMWKWCITGSSSDAYRALRRGSVWYVTVHRK